MISINKFLTDNKLMLNVATALGASNNAGSNRVYPGRRREMLRELETAGLPLAEGPGLSALNRNLCVGLPRFTGNTFPGINVFGLAVPHAVCLEDSDKWLDNKTRNGRRQTPHPPRSPSIPPLFTSAHRQGACVLCVCVQDLCVHLRPLLPSPQPVACPLFIRVGSAHAKSGQNIHPVLPDSVYRTQSRNY